MGATIAPGRAGIFRLLCVAALIGAAVALLPIASAAAGPSAGRHRLYWIPDVTGSRLDRARERILDAHLKPKVANPGLVCPGGVDGKRVASEHPRAHKLARGGAPVTLVVRCSGSYRGGRRL